MAHNTEVLEFVDNEFTELKIPFPKDDSYELSVDTLKGVVTFGYTHEEPVAIFTIPEIKNGESGIGFHVIEKQETYLRIAVGKAKQLVKANRAYYLDSDGTGVGVIDLRDAKATPTTGFVHDIYPFVLGRTGKNTAAYYWS